MIHYGLPLPTTPDSRSAAVRDRQPQSPTRYVNYR